MTAFIIAQCLADGLIIAMLWYIIKNFIEDDWL